MTTPNTVEDIIQQYHLRKVTYDSKSVFQRYFGLYKEPISNMCFSDVYMWAERYSYYWKEHHDSLLVYSFSGGDPSLLFPPLGESYNGAMEETASIFSDMGLKEFNIEYVTSEQIGKFSKHTYKNRSSDYIYETEKMITLEGNGLHSQRNRRNAFCKRYKWEVDAYSQKYKDQCLSLLDSIKINHNNPNKKFICEIEASRRLFDDPDKLDLKGSVLLVNDNVIGVTFGTMLNGTMCNILMEKTSKKCIGSAQMIFSEFCKNWKDMKWCNTGDDWGISSLVTVKESYRPVRRLPKWTVIYPTNGS